MSFNVESEKILLLIKFTFLIVASLPSKTSKTKLTLFSSTRIIFGSTKVEKNLVFYKVLEFFLNLI